MNLVITTVRPATMLATVAEVNAVIISLATQGIIQASAKSQGNPHAAARLAEEYTLGLSPNVLAVAQAAGYGPWVIEFAGATPAAGTVDTPGEGSPIALMPGQYFYSELAAVLAQKLAEYPNGKWTVLPDGSITRG